MHFSDSSPISHGAKRNQMPRGPELATLPPAEQPRNSIETDPWGKTTCGGKDMESATRIRSESTPGKSQRTF
jgi:hypothetical protein